MYALDVYKVLCLGISRGLALGVLFFCFVLFSEFDSACIYDADFLFVF